MTTRFFGKPSAGLRARWLRGSIDKALAVNRYEVRLDGLLLGDTSFRFAITWRARGIHPWDGDLTADCILLLYRCLFSSTDICAAK